MEVVIFVLFVFIYSVTLCFLQDVFTKCSGKPIAAVSIFMTGNSLYLRWWSQLWRSLLLFFVLMSLDAMFSFHINLTFKLSKDVFIFIIPVLECRLYQQGIDSIEEDPHQFDRCYFLVALAHHRDGFFVLRYHLNKMKLHQKPSLQLFCNTSMQSHNSL